MSDLSSLADKLARVGAPILGGLIGGPVGALVPVVIGALADALGTDPTPDAISKAIAEKPEAKAVVQRVEANQGSGLTQLEVELRDIQDARAATANLVNQGSAIAWGAALISILIVIGFLSVLFIFLVKPVPLNEIQATVLNVLLGTLTLSFGQVCNYWLGSSAGSTRSGDTIRKIALSKNG